MSYAYENDELAPPKLPRIVLKELLLACTTEAPFRSPCGQLYTQCDGVAMGSPLGVLFANAYMCYIEQQALQSLEKQPYIYKRYIDDIYLEIESEEELEILRRRLEEVSVLKFTHEIGVDGKLPFLDVCVNVTNGKRSTNVYRKKTDGNACLNGSSECPARYKRGVIRTYVRRAIKICSSWELFNQEMTHVKQMLVNNDYTVADIDREIEAAVSDFIKPENRSKNGDKNTHVLFYKNQMSPAYKLDERILKDIIKSHVTPTGNDRLKLLVYYKNRRTANMIMRNNQYKDRATTEMHQCSIRIHMPS